MRVVSIEPDAEITLLSDQPTTMHVTTRMTDAGEGQTQVARSFLWDEPSDPDIAEGLRQMMQAMVGAGEAAIRDVFASTTPTA
jgi:hypothetical protein